MGEVTELLAASNGGDAAALERLLPIVYDELRALARRQLRGERRGHTLQPTALVHEAFLRLAGAERGHAGDRRQFCAMAATAMRRVLLDHARARLAEKRGAGAARVTLSEVDAATPAGDVDVIALDGALSRLEAFDARAARVVELKYFAGLSDAETAEAVGVSVATVKRDWTAARAWLRRELRE